MKYCGGCRARFDRVGVIEQIRSRFADEIQFVEPNSEEASMVLVVNGCATACADISGFGSRTAQGIQSPEDAVRWMAELGRTLGKVFTSCNKS